jgi:hypothetical protein
MNKLLVAFKTAPTEANRIKLQKYISKHMMAICCAPLEDQQYLKANGFNI